MATIRKRGTGWYVQVRRKGYPAEYKTFGSKAEATAWAREREARIDRREQPVGTQLSECLGNAVALGAFDGGEAGFEPDLPSEDPGFTCILTILSAQLV